MTILKPEEDKKQSVALGTSPMSLTSKNKSGLVKVPVYFIVYQPKFLTKCPFRLVDN